MEREGKAERKVAKHYKFVVLGDANVGKSNLIERVVRGTFSEQQTTVGVEFFRKMYEIDGVLFCVNIWDTAGQERFRAASLPALFYRDCAGVACVFDITDRASFEHIPKWLEEIERHNTGSPIPVCLVGNKSDLAEERKVSEAEARELLRGKALDYIECSAKTGEGTDAPFDLLLTHCTDEYFEMTRPGGDLLDSGEDDDVTYHAGPVSPNIDISRSANRHHQDQQSSCC